jgi:hypothetical protein
LFINMWSMDMMQTFWRILNPQPLVLICKLSDNLTLASQLWGLLDRK